MTVAEDIVRQLKTSLTAEEWDAAPESWRAQWRSSVELVQRALDQAAWGGARDCCPKHGYAWWPGCCATEQADGSGT